MSDDPIRRLLRQVDGAAAPPGFATRVIAAVERRPRRVASLPLRVAAVGALAAALVTGVSWRAVERREARAEELRAQAATLRGELEELSRVVKDGQPVVLLGEAGEFGVYLELGSSEAARLPAGAVEEARSKAVSPMVRRVSAPM